MIGCLFFGVRGFSVMMVMFTIVISIATILLLFFLVLSLGGSDYKIHVHVDRSSYDVSRPIGPVGQGVPGHYFGYCRGLNITSIIALYSQKNRRHHYGPWF